MLICKCIYYRNDTKMTKCDSCGYTIEGHGHIDLIGSPSIHDIKTNKYSGLICNSCYREIVQELEE